MPRELLTPRWILTTLLVAVAVGVMARLGVWQLDRLAQRRAFNQRVEAQIHAPELSLNNPVDPQALYEMEYRPVVARGVFDHENEILLRNQYWEGELGVHVLTPLVLEGSDYSILVDRGYLPMEQSIAEQRAAYNRNGTVEVRGILLRGHVPQIFGVPDPTLAPGETRLETWNSVNLTRIGEQIDSPLYPIYLQAAPPEGGVQSLPYASLDQPDISEGPHFGYAMQWFGFALVLGLGYPFFVKKNLSQLKGQQGT